MTNRLYKYVSERIDNLWDLSSYQDRIMGTTSLMFMRSPQYKEITYTPCWTWGQRVEDAYLSWVDTLLPHDLEGRFTEHEIMELFTDE